jgi:hypothetical protein
MPSAFSAIDLVSRLHGSVLGFPVALPAAGSSVALGSALTEGDDVGDVPVSELAVVEADPQPPTARSGTSRRLGTHRTFLMSSTLSIRRR